MNRREFLSLIAAAPLAATLAPMRGPSVVIPMTYVGIEDIDGIDWYKWQAPEDTMLACAELYADYTPRRRYTYVYGRL